jgi:hypothetical protein|tara:strand:+ start:137 stop:760 length:624 start_codon:yes stop_codon:yes gene_type:complete
MKNNFIVGFIVFALLGFTGIIFNSAAGSRVRAELAEERVEELKEKRLLIEEQLLESYKYYDVLKDSLDQAHDSLAEIRESAKNEALRSSVSFDENLTTLRDSLANQGVLEALLDTLELNHRKEVSSYQVQVATLEEDKLLLWRRVQVLDSTWSMDQRVNESLRREITALNEQSDAWKSVANRGVFSKIGGSVPYILAGVALGSLIRN